jgi:hypothetical protein
MLRISLAPAPLLVLALTGGAAGGPGPFVHLQTDRPSYRLGETIWFRAHSPERTPVKLSLLSPEEKELERAVLDGAEEWPFSGRFMVPADAAGGTFHLEARVEGALVHRLPLEVYDIALPRLELELVILGEAHLPGKPVAAAFRARDLEGRPVKGARVEYRAAFGAITLRGSAGLTDGEGRALLRFTLPEEVSRSGQLAVGLPVAGKEAAVARPVRVSAPIAAVDGFPEGGAIVAGHPQKIALLVRDRNGETAAASGRVLDGQDRTVAGFRTGPRGLATVLVPYLEGQSYRVAIDEPAGVEEEFRLPEPGDHRFAMLVEEKEEGIAVEVRGRKPEMGKRLELVLSTSDQVLSRSEVRLQPEDRGARCAARAILKRPKMAGLAQLIVEEKGRALLKRPVFLGARSPVTVTLKPKGHAPLLPGKPVEFELKATSHGEPVQADLALSIFQGDPAGIQDLAVRSFIEPALTPGFTVPPEVVENDQEREAFLLVHQTFRFPREGVPLGSTGLPDPAAGRVTPAPLSPVPPSGAETLPPRGSTVARFANLERLLERASFTRSLRAQPEAHSFRPRIAPEALLAAPGLGKKSPLTPQMLRLPPEVLDCRRTLYWSGSVRTDSAGRATIGFRLNHLVSDLAWVAQGYAGEVPIAARGSVSPVAGFGSKFEFPDHLQVGDFLDLLVEIESRDPQGGSIEIEIQAPPCLKPRLRTRLSFDPSKDARLQRFQFEAAAPAEAAELRWVARRGLYEEVQARRFRVSHHEVELSFGESGRVQGPRSFSLTVPPAALPGSIRAFGRVLPGFTAQAGELRADMVRQPAGCFEQFTSINGLNLVILDALLERGEDPATLAQAYLFATEGFQRLLTYFDPSRGGFSLWPGKQCELHPTLVALPQLALYERIFPGRGRKELEAALGWLETQKMASSELLYLTFALHDMGRAWKGSIPAATLETTSLYEAALQAACLAAWPGEPPPKTKLAGIPLEERLAKLLDRLERADMEQNLHIAGDGLMGSAGGQLSVEILALAAVAFQQAGRQAAAQSCLTRLVEREGQNGGTQARALAMRAYSKLTPPLVPKALDVEFTAGPGAPRRVVAFPAQARPLTFERELFVKAGGAATVAVNVHSADPQLYRLGVSYRVREPRSSPEAPFELSTQLIPEADQHSPVEMRLSIQPRGRTGSSQVVARIGLPAAIQLQDEALRELAKKGEISFFELQAGYLNLYWSRAIDRPLHFKLPAIALVAGRFSAPPSLIYPYYESGKEYYAAPLAINVHNNFGRKTPDLLRPGSPVRRG